MRQNRKGQNLLDLVPEKLHPSMEEKGNVTILVENKGIFNRFGQKFLKKPVQSKIQLDPLGSFIWTHIDGKTSIYEIAQKVEEQFGETGFVFEYAGHQFVDVQAAVERDAA